MSLSAHASAVSGTRQGELLGPRWKDVDLERGTIRVFGQLQAEPGQPRGQSLVVNEPLIDDKVLPRRATGRNAPFVEAFGDPAMINAWWASERLARSGAGRRVARALAQAAQWIERPENLDEAIRIITKWTKGDPELLRRTLHEEQFFVAYPDGFRDAPRFLNPVVGALVDLGTLKKTIDVKRLIANFD